MPLAGGFQNEATVLLNLSSKLTFKERKDFLRRMFFAKNSIQSFSLDLKRKAKSLKAMCEVLKDSDDDLHMGLVLECLRDKLQALLSKQVPLSVSQLDLAVETFDRVVDQGITEQNDQMNKIMLAFTTITLLLMPP